MCGSQESLRWRGASCIVSTLAIPHTAIPLLVLPLSCIQLPRAWICLTVYRLYLFSCDLEYLLIWNSFWKKWSEVAPILTNSLILERFEFYENKKANLMLYFTYNSTNSRSFSGTKKVSADVWVWGPKGNREKGWHKCISKSIFSHICIVWQMPQFSLALSFSHCQRNLFVDFLTWGL